jgi:hypothetical protein
MKELHKIVFEDPVKVTGINEGNGLTFSDGTTITDYHEQDCCESVYADWGQLNDQLITEDDTKELVISGNPLIGIVLNGKYAVPCYNEQNGYYSSDLQLVIKQPGKPDFILDISEYVEDQID